MPFRLAALRAGLELEAGTSPPVLRPVPGFKPAKASSRPPESEKDAKRHDVVRAYLGLLGPATPKHVADYLDAPVRDVKARWPSDAIEVSVDGDTRWVLAADAERLSAERAGATRLLGPFVLLDGDIAGMWRPRKSGKSFRVQVNLWVKASTSVRNAIEEQAERLAAYRQVSLTGIDLDG